MDVTNYNILLFVVFLVLSSFVNVVLFKKHILVFLDPWLIVILNQIIIITVILYYWYMGLIIEAHLIYSLSCLLFFSIGLNGFYKISSSSKKPREFIKAKTTSLMISILLILHLANWFVTIVLLGPSILEGGRNISQFAALGKFYGIFYYLDWASKSCLFPLLIKSWFVDKKTWAPKVIIIITLLSFFNGAGKLAYLSLVMYLCLATYGYNKLYNEKRKIPSWIKYSLYPLPIFILIAFLPSVNAGYADNIFIAFIKRLIGTAEGPFYYFVGESYHYFEGVNLSFLKYLFSNVLPYFGVIDKETINLGVNLTAESTFHFGTNGFGPNPTMYVLGFIFFSYYGFILCYILGLVLSFYRYRYTDNFIIWLYLNSLLTGLLMDPTLVFLDIFYILILLIPIYIFSKIFLSATQNIRFNI
jgi:hypothetical protein